MPDTTDARADPSKPPPTPVLAVDDAIASWQVSVQCFLPCSAVRVSGSRLHILDGGPDALVFEEFPGQIPLSLATRLTVEGHPPPTEVPIRITCTDPRGEEALPPLVATLFGTDERTLDPPGPLTIVLPIDLTPFPVREQGTYTFELLVGSRLVSRAAFDAKRA